MSLFKSVLLAVAAASSAIAYTGEMTYFNQGLGSCGETHYDSEAVVALAASDYGTYANPNLAPVCGKWIKITANGQTVRAQVVDTCPGGECGPGSIDVSPSVFQQFAALTVGRLYNVQWEYEDASGGDTPVVTTSEAPVVPTTTSEVVVPPTTTSEVVVPTTTSEVVVPTTTSEVVVPTTTSEVAVPTTTSAVVVPSTTSTSIAAPPTTFSTRVRPSTTSQAATTTTILPGNVYKESDKVKVVVVTEMVTVTVTSVPTAV